MSAKHQIRDKHREYYKDPKEGQEIRLLNQHYYVPGAHFLNLSHIGALDMLAYLEATEHSIDQTFPKAPLRAGKHYRGQGICLVCSLMPPSTCQYACDGVVFNHPCWINE